MKRLRCDPGCCRGGVQEPQLQEHMRPVLEELFGALQARAAAGAPGPEAATLRLVIHVVNSMRMACR